ncbi:hypothetical protein BC332_02598 [Capsicum chinense]|nr:hypothetical protein BC332_02598 [Capsicum chinense]
MMRNIESSVSVPDSQLLTKTSCYSSHSVNFGFRLASPSSSSIVLSGASSVIMLMIFKVYISALKLVRSMSNMRAKNHGTVIPDANTDITINALVAVDFGTAGQRCMALSTVVFVRN